MHIAAYNLTRKQAIKQQLKDFVKKITAEKNIIPSTKNQTCQYVTEQKCVHWLSIGLKPCATKYRLPPLSDSSLSDSSTLSTPLYYTQDSFIQ